MAHGLQGMHTGARNSIPVKAWLALPVRRSQSLAQLDQGQVAVLFALSVLPIALIAGFAIDFQMLTTKKSKAQYSIDSAVIAGTRDYQEGASESQVSHTVTAYFESALASTESNLDCTTPIVTIDDTDVEATSTCSMKTTLSAIAGIEQMDFQLSTATTYGIGKVDVSFVFDISGSMGGSRISDLRSAAHDAVDALLVEHPKPGQEDDVRLSMVAYNGAFNAGDYFQTVTGQTPDQTYTYYHDGRWRHFDYSTTCVFERSGGEAFTDALPGPSQYLSAANVYQRDDCDNIEPRELTSNRVPLHDYIDELEAGGNTAGHLGVAWGWYMISPAWTSILPAGSEPLPYREPDTAKALVLMTDGAFNTVGDTDNGSSSWQARKLCDELKEEGIIVYSVAFQAPSAGEDVLRDCASGADYFFKPSDGDQLRDAYQSIASSISDLRITR